MPAPPDDNPHGVPAASDDLNEIVLPPTLEDPTQTHARRNFATLVLYHVLLRTGWIFKTESIVMPAVLDSMGGSAWMRGFLPLLNRVSLSLPPLFFARRLKLTHHKKWVLMGCTMGMATVFLVLAAIWWAVDSTQQAWLPIVFLALYGLFFVVNGLNQLTAGTLQGKLVRPTWRGRLLVVATTIGAATAIAAAVLLMPRWLTPTTGQFDYIFGLTGLLFAVAAISTIWLDEPADNFQEPKQSFTDRFRLMFTMLREDRNFRILAGVAALFGSSMILFPHYQAYARESLGLTLENIVWWVVIQNTGTVIFSLLAGPLADARGNRLVLRIILLGVAAVPLIAVGLAHAGDFGRSWYGLVFMFVGLTPVTFRILYNYTLETCGREHHPQRLATIALCLALPTFLSPLVGAVIGWIGFDGVFIAVSVTVLVGWALTSLLAEPRREKVKSELPKG